MHDSVIRICSKSAFYEYLRRTIIYQKSLIEGILPADWKVATVIPIFKKSNKHEASNYRPVSLTAVPCKVLKSIIRLGLKNIPSQTRLKRLDLCSLERPRLRGGLIDLVTGKERVDSSIFLRLADDTTGLERHSVKLFKPRCRTTIR